MGGFPCSDVAWPPVPWRRGDRGATPSADWFPLARLVVCGVLRLFRGSRIGSGRPCGLVRHGDDGRGGAGDRVLRAGVAEGARGLGLAGAVPVPVDNGPEPGDLA